MQRVTPTHLAAAGCCVLFLLAGMATARAQTPDHSFVTGALPLPAPVQNDGDAADMTKPAIRPPDAADPMAGVEDLSAGSDATDDPLAWDSTQDAAPPSAASADTPPAGDAQAELPLAADPLAPEDPVAVPLPGTAAETPIVEDSLVAPQTGEAASPAAVPEVAAPDVALQDRVARLEKDLDDVHQSIVDLSLAIDGMKGDITLLQKKPAEEKPAAEKAPVKKKKAAAPKPAPVPEWVLKSAQQGAAWVAQKGTSELRAIGLGETLPGLGKITAIEQDAAGRWVVTGTQGTLRQ